MASRKRRRLRWPDNLYENEAKGRIFYRYRNPKTGRWHGMGSNLEAAKQAARILNARLITGGSAERLVDQVMTGRPSFDAVADRFWEHLQERLRGGQPLAPTTLGNYRLELAGFREAWGGRAFDSISLRDIAEFLDALPANAANAHKSLLSQLYDFALATGLRLSQPGEPDNPARVALKRDVVVKRQRLDLDAYQAIHERAGELGTPWFQTAMDLALHTLQRRQTIVVMRYDDEREPGRLFVDQQKVERYGTGHIVIPIGAELRATIDRSRDRIVSPYLVHVKPGHFQRDQVAKKDHWSMVSREKISKTFSRLRDALKLYRELPKEARPTFHEIRALGGDLYRKAGWSEEEVQRLMGHSTIEMTRAYLDRRGAEVRYVEAPEAGLSL